MAVQRKLLKPAAEKPRGNYFAGPKENLDFIPTGSKLLDLILGGGWAERRIANVIGDKSTGKTLLMIDACANFAKKHPKGKIYYREFEHAFDEEYADAIGMPIGRVDFNDNMETIEDVFEDLSAIAKKAVGEPILYIIDSLDSLTSRAEQEREIDEASYGTEKARQLSQVFRRKTGEWKRKNITILIVSQIRDNITTIPNAKKTKRTGGRAMDFYPSQIITLAQLKLHKRTIRGIERPTGILVKATCDKNKIGLAHRHTEFSIMFGFGVDDVENCLEFIVLTLGRENSRDEDLLKGMGFNCTKAGIAAFKKTLSKLDDKTYWAHVRHIHDITERLWRELEHEFMPKRRKYS